MEIPSDGLSDEEIRRILSLKNVAVVGMSRDPSKPAHFVPKFLLKHGYNVVPVNPFTGEILGLKAYPSLRDVPVEIDIVDIFRPSDQVYPVVKEALVKSPKVIWMQEGIYNEEAVRLARENKIVVVWNRCMMREHNRLFGSRPYISMRKL